MKATVESHLLVCLERSRGRDFKRGYIEVQEGKCYHLCIFPGVAARGGCLGVATEHGSNNDIGELQQGAGYYLTLLFFTNN